MKLPLVHKDDMDTLLHFNYKDLLEGPKKIGWTIRLYGQFYLGRF